MSENILRATKALKISITEIPSECAFFNQGKCLSYVPKNASRTQKFLFNSDFSVFFSIIEQKIFVADLRNNKQFVYEVNDTILPIIEVDEEIGDSGAHFVTATGVLFKIGLEGLLYHVELPFVPNSIHISNGNIYLGKSNGEVSLFMEDKIIFSVNQPVSFLTNVISLFKSTNPVLAISTSQRYLYFLTSDCKIYTVSVEDRRVISESSLFNKKATNAILRVNGNKLLVVLNTETTSVLKVLEERSMDLSVVCDFERENIIDADLNGDYFSLIEGKDQYVSFNRYETATGSLISSDWTPSDDYQLSLRFLSSKADIQPNCDNSTASAIMPITCASDKNNNIYISSKSNIYQMRPLADIEDIRLFLSTEPKFDTVNNFASAVANLLNKDQWLFIDTRLKIGENPRVVMQNILNQIHEQPPEDINQHTIASQFQDSYNELNLPVVQWTSPVQMSSFWASAVAQVSKSASFHARALLLLAEYLIARCNYTNLTQIANDLNTLVVNYTAIDIVAESDAIETVSLFENIDFSYSDFSNQVKFQLGRLLHPEEVTTELLNGKKASVVFSYIRLFPGKYVQEAFAMLDINQGENAVKFFYDNKDLFDLRPHYKFVIKKLVDLGNNNNLKRFCELVYDMDPEFISSILFRTYIIAAQYQDAFYMIMKAPNQSIRIDEIRILVRELVKKRKVDQLVSYNFGQYLSLITNELMSYSVDTLPASALIMNKLGDKAGAIDALYKYARNLLRENNVESMKKAMTALLTCKSLIISNSTIEIRDVSSNSTVKREKIDRIIAKLKVCLNDENPINIVKLPNIDILGIALNQGVQSLVQFANSGVPKPEDLATFAQKLIQNGDYSTLSKLLEVDRREWHFTLYENSLLEFLNHGDPPYWFTVSMIKKCKVQFFLICASKMARYTALDGLIILHDNNEKLPPQLLYTLQKLGLSDQQIKTFVDN